jgi:RNA-directed DNA polymerase
MEWVLAPANLRRAYQRVASNKDAPGGDGITSKVYAPSTFPNPKTAPNSWHPQRRGSPDPTGFAATSPLFSNYSYGFRPGQKRLSSHRNRLLLDLWARS